MQSTVSQKERLSLSVLNAGCSLRTTWTGTNEAVLLQCRREEFLITTPSNLFGHVAIRTPARALEFVRFFSSPESYRWFELDAMVELLPGNVTAQSDFNVVDEVTFTKFGLTHYSARDVTAAGDKDRVFEVRRTVVMDQRVFEIAEAVTARGYYRVISKRQLIDNAAKIGVLHLGDL
jgi:hypothetical protein